MRVVEYKVAQGKGKPPVSVFVETDLPKEPKVRLASADKILRDATEDFQKAIKPVLAVARALGESLIEVKPTEFTVEFGFELGGEAGIPHIIKSAAKATFKVELVWKDIKR